MNWFKRNNVKTVEKVAPVVSNYSYSSGSQVSNYTPATTGQKSYPTYTVDALAQRFGYPNYISTGEVLGIEAFYSCMMDQCGSLGSLPLRMYRKGLLDDKPARVESGLEFEVFCRRPCEYMSMQEFIEMLVITYHTAGAFYALPVRNEKGRIVELLPFANQNNITTQMDFNGNVWVTYTTNDNKPIGPMPIESLFVVKNTTMDGYRPLRPIIYQAQLLGMAKSQEDNYSTLQNEGVTAQMYLSTDNKFEGKEARERLRDDFNEFRGSKGVRSIPILEQGLKVQSLNLTPQEMDLLNQRQFTVKRICAMTQTMPHRISAETLKTSDKIYELDEAQFKKWNPLLCKIESEMNRLLGRYLTITFHRKAFYAGSPARLVESVEKELKGGMCSVAEAREDLGRDYIPGTEDIYCIASNNCTYGSWDDLKKLNQQQQENNTGDNDE